MNKRHLVVVFTTIFMVVALIVGVSVLLRKYAAKADADRRQQEIAEHAERIGEFEDYMVYYIGEPPIELETGIPNITVLTPGLMNRNTLPVSWSDIHFIEMDNNNNVVNEVQPRDYPEYMLIYVGSDVTLTEDQLELLRDCNIENDVPLIIEGATNINAYREYIFMVSHDLGDHATCMFAPWGQPQDNIIPEEVVTGDKAGFVNALIDVILSNAEKIDAYNVDTLVEVETEATTTTVEEIQETEETEETDEA